MPGRRSRSFWPLAGLAALALNALLPSFTGDAVASMVSVATADDNADAFALIDTQGHVVDLLQVDAE